MPGAPRTIVIGGGIDGVAPLGIDEYLFVVSITPPAASSSPRLMRRATSTEILGDGTNSTSIGSNADANGAENIVIGRDCSAVGGGAPSDIIVIGQNMDNTGAVSEVILIGHDVSSNGSGTIIIGATTSPANISSAVCIGFGQTFAGSNNNVTIGFGASTGGGNTVAVGNGASGGTGAVSIGNTASSASAGSSQICIGNAAQANGTSTGNIIIGASSLTSNISNILFIGHNLRTDNGTYASGDVVIGHNNVGGLGFSSRVIWFGDLHTTATVVPAAAMRWKNAQGTNIAAGDITITAPRATGNAVGGAIVLQTAPAGASGVTLQTATTRLTIAVTGQATFATPTGAIENIVIAGAGGAAQPSIRLNNLTNGAGASAGTLANAPSVGNPSFWIPINIAGAVRFIPAWT